MRKHSEEGEEEPSEPSAEGSTRRHGDRGRGGRVTALLGTLAALLNRLLRTLGRLTGRLHGPVRAAGRRLGAIVAVVSRAVTPVRGVLVAALACAALLGLSQFADYRGVAIGVDDYAGVETVAPAPEVDRAELGTAHGYAMIPAAAVAMLLLALAAARGRWQLCRLAALIGIAAVAISIFIDRPTGLDEGSLARDFAGVEAQILGGWWVQLFAGIGLALTSLLLADEIRRSGTGAKTKRRRSPASERARRRELGSAEAKEAGA